MSLKHDYVTQLLTGRFDTIKIHSGTKQVFIPNKINKYGTLRELQINKEGIPTQKLKEEEGIILLPININRLEFKKETKEKELLKKMKSQFKKQPNEALKAEILHLIGTYNDHVSLPKWGMNSGVIVLK
jgi:hypothetical protein